jgi:hypothetical protein
MGETGIIDALLAEFPALFIFLQQLGWISIVLRDL